MNIIFKIIINLILIVHFSANCSKEITLSDVQKLILTNINNKVILGGVEFTKIAGFGPTSSTIERKHYFWTEQYKIKHTRDSQIWHVQINRNSYPTMLGTVTIFCVPFALCLFSAMYRQYNANTHNNL